MHGYGDTHQMHPLHVYLTFHLLQSSQVETAEVARLKKKAKKGEPRKDPLVQQVRSHAEPTINLGYDGLFAVLL